MTSDKQIQISSIKAQGVTVHTRINLKNVDTVSYSDQANNVKSNLNLLKLC